jgi:adenosylcobinamide kinase/adenosylcobinamide-phosphate guanylyltransferase
MIHLITGGARSGKSGYAEKLALKGDNRPTYIATARHWDEDFSHRIRHHQLNRGPEWENLEIEKRISEAKIKSRWVVIDCITLWLTNIFYDNKQEVQKSLQEAKLEINQIVLLQDINWIIVTNELGMGLHAETAVGRKFIDLQGWTNQYLAQKSDIVTLMISGMPVQIK